MLRVTAAGVGHRDGSHRDHLRDRGEKRMSFCAATRKKRRTRFIPSAFDRRRPLPVEALEALEALGA